VPTFRFAPSPNGYLHEGHALSALLNHDAAIATGGKLLLRIEDIYFDHARPEFEAAIMADLTWLGVAWTGDVMRQSERLEVYRSAVDTLVERGLLYPALMGRAKVRKFVAEKDKVGDILPRDPDGAPLYPGTERNWPQSRRQAAINGGDPYALRLDINRAVAEAGPLSWTERNPFDPSDVQTIEADPAAWGDVALARRGFPASYHLSVCLDDAEQGVTHIVRGGDLHAVTSIHRLIQKLLELPEPDYWHHRLILDEAGGKLSKSEGALALRAMREAGKSPDNIRASVGVPKAR